jgi:acyl carrier protein
MKEEKIVVDIVSSLVANELRNSIRMSSRLAEDLGLDSMALIRLALHLEEKANFDIENTDFDLGALVTVEDIVVLISPQTK